MRKNLHKGLIQLDGTASPARRFLGLKWKVLLLSSLILIAIVVSFTSITYVSLMDDFESQREAQHQRYASEVEGLIDQVVKNLHQLAELIPFMEGMGDDLLKGNGKRITETFDPYWALLQLNKGIELVRFYDNSHQLLASWGIFETDTHEGPMLEWVRDVNSREQPISPLRCKKKLHAVRGGAAAG